MHNAALFRQMVAGRDRNLPYSSSVSSRSPDAGWATGSGDGVISAKFTPGPDGRGGNGMASLFRETTADSSRFITSPTFSASTALWRMSIFLKPWGIAKRFLLIQYSDNIANATNMTIDLGSGVLTQHADVGSDVTKRIQLSRLNNGWYRVQTFVNLTAATVFVGIALGATEANASAAGSYVGDGVSGVLVWGLDVRLADGATG